MAREKTSILIYVESWGRGGIEMFIMNTLRALNDQFEFTLFSVYDWDCHYDMELAQLGVERIARFPGEKPGLAKRFVEGMRAFRLILSNRSYDVVWINTMNGSGLVYAQIAKQAGVARCVVHSHNSAFGTGGAIVKTIVHRACKALFSSAPTARVACSGDSGRWLFGTDAYFVVPNAIDTERFRFDEDARVKMRASLDIGCSEVLVGTVGRHVPEKNHSFLLRSFAKVARLNAHLKLLLVGTGEEESMLRTLAQDLGIDPSVIWMPSSDDVPSLLSAMDLFVMPSLFEGLPFSIVEAQASGLPVVASEGISREVAITDRVEFLSLETALWASRMSEATLSADAPIRFSAADEVDEAGFGIRSLATSMKGVLSGELRHLSPENGV